MAPSACSAWVLMVAGTFGSLVARAICTLTSPFSIWTDFTRPNETISRVNPGYFTDFKAFFTCSSEIDISELTRVALEVNSALRFAAVRGGSASPEDDGRGNAEGANSSSHGVARIQKLRGIAAFISNALRTTRSTFVPSCPDNPFCSESDTRFHQLGGKVAGPVSPQSPGFASQTRRDISLSLDWRAT